MDISSNFHDYIQEKIEFKDLEDKEAFFTYIKNALFDYEYYKWHIDKTVTFLEQQKISPERLQMILQRYRQWLIYNKKGKGAKDLDKHISKIEHSKQIRKHVNRIINKGEEGDFFYHLYALSKHCSNRFTKIAFIKLTYPFFGRDYTFKSYSKKFYDAKN